jgi:hypothetical protein
MSEGLSNFQIYWRRLKKDDPETYQSRLKVNRDRLKNIRKNIYEDPDKHKAHLERERERYRRRKDAKSD